MAGTGIDERINTACLEDDDVLIEIQDMALRRASAVAVRLKPISFDRHTTVMSKLKALKQFVYSLAPKFINMDYPYADTEWTQFPIKYNAQYRSYHGVQYRDDIADDEEHNLNVLPQIGSSFDNKSIDLYRKFLHNLVYWLKKFRYVEYRNSQVAYYNRTLQRAWNWSQGFDPVDGSLEYDAYENGTHVPDKSVSELKRGTTGRVYRNSASTFPNGSLVQGSTYSQEAKGYRRLLQRNTPLYEGIEKWSGMTMTNIPENIIFQNPTVYQATALIYVIPYAYRDQSNNVYKDEIIDEVTQLDAGTVETWGDHNQFSATKYNSTAGRYSNTTDVKRRSQWKQTNSDTKQGTTERVVETNWSEDGERSAVILDETTTVPFYVPSSNYHDVDEVINPGFFNTTLTNPKYEAGSIPPHDQITIEVCTTDTMPILPYPTPEHVGTSCYTYDVYSRAQASYIIIDYWVPVLDYGDFVIPEPEEP